MRITKIELENWCQYEGEHVLDFGMDADKNVVLVHADNDVGKSSLFYCLAWCFHENMPDKWRKNKWPLYPLPWFNRASNGDVIETKIEINFEHRGEHYAAIRAFKTNKNNNTAIKLDETFSFQRRNYNGNWQSEGEDKLNRILPKSVSGYFIFDAEEVEHFANQSDKVQQSVLRLLDIEDADRASDHIQQVASEYRRRLNRSPDNKIAELEAQLEKIEQSIHDITKLLNDQDNGLKILLKIAREERKRTEEKLFTYKEAHDLLEEESRTISNITKNNNKYLETLRAIKSNTQNFYLTLLQPIASETLAYLDDKRKKGELPKNVKKQFVVERIDMGECICGTDLHRNPKCLEKISAFAESLSDELSDISQGLSYQLLKMQGSGKSIVEKTDLLLRSLRELKDEKQTLERKLKDVRSKIQQRDGVPDVPALQLKKEKLENKESSLIRQIQLNESDLANKEESKEQWHKVIIEARKKAAVVNDAELYWQLAITAQDALTKAIRSFKDKARRYLEQQCNLVARQLFWREDVYTINIGNDYSISVSSPEYGDRDLLAGMSMGATQMAGLSLIAALAKQTKAQAPLIMDTPFARLSPAHITRALSECPKHFQQWILFLQPSEWNDSKYRQVIHTKIQAEYTLQRNNETGVTKPVKGYHRDYFGRVMGGANE